MAHFCAASKKNVADFTYSDYLSVASKSAAFALTEVPDQVMPSDPITYFLMPGQGHIPALLDPGKSQHALNNDGSSPDLQAASCAVRNILFKVLELPNGGANAASQP